jgi:glycosyltransferase involved in cell wall biosynthesis
LLLAQLYKQYYPQNEVILFAEAQMSFPNVDKVVIIDDIENLPQKAKTEGTDILVVSAVHNGKPLADAFFSDIESKELKTVVWGHNFYLSDFCNKLAKYTYVKANVFVGRQQYDRYVDHKVINKSTYIYNMYPQTQEKVRDNTTQKSVTYIGSIVKEKGFHILAHAWKDVLKEVPDAVLNVIGSGKLYRKDAKIGKYGVAEETYENSFMNSLLDENGEILPSVQFLGLMGAEKNDIIAKTAVGVVNPTGRTETFGISAIDFESFGVPVVTIAKGGFLDTVIHKETGLLYRDTKDIAKYIVELLNDTDKNISYGKNGKILSKRFAPENIICEWNELFSKVYNGEKLCYRKPNSFMGTNLKRIRAINRTIKNVLNLEYPLSVIGFETLLRNLLRRLGK